MRIEQEEFQEWNMMFSMLVQVTCGRISDNMRRVGLRRENGDWIVEFIISQDDDQDREDIEDIAIELSFLSDDNAEGLVHPRIIVDSGPITNFPKFSGFEGPLFWRKEN
jgi:hypothetical protein